MAALAFNHVLAKIKNTEKRFNGCAPKRQTQHEYEQYKITVSVTRANKRILEMSKALFGLNETKITADKFYRIMDG